jgi:predicted DNA-binding transcriptional regulator YafY
MSNPFFAVQIDYTNYRGERKEYRIKPGRIFFGHTDYHPEAQWLLEATDLDRQVPRTFAMKDVHGWRPATDPEIVSTPAPNLIG